MLKISFNFDETSQLVSNIKVEHVTGTKTRGILTTNAPTNEKNFGPDVEVLENKLQLSKAALFKLDAKADDRISIQYVSEGIGKSSPLIGKAAAFTDRNDGNRLTAKEQGYCAISTTKGFRIIAKALCSFISEGCKARPSPRGWCLVRGR